MTIKAIETVYNGYKFRSRLEARWAVFFDALEVKYEYEPQGFHLPSGPYLPDFWLPNHEVWVEIKPDRTNEPLARAANLREYKLCQELAEETDGIVWLIRGTCGYKDDDHKHPPVEILSTGAQGPTTFSYDIVLFCADMILDYYFQKSRSKSPNGINPSFGFRMGYQNKPGAVYESNFTSSQYYYGEVFEKFGGSIDFPTRGNAKALINLWPERWPYGIAGNRYVFTGAWTPWWLESDCRLRLSWGNQRQSDVSRFMKRALIKARQARFEHGESG